jgi:hypothetical protein
MDRLAKGSNAALILVDSTQKVLATIALENRPDAESLAQEVETIIEAATRLPELP